jgi:hypothetical protein
MTTVIIAAAAGVFGNGWLTEVSDGADASLTIHYPRFHRAHSPFELVAEGTPRQADFVVWIERRYLEKFAVDEIAPEPVVVTADTERIYYTFAARAGSARVTATMRLRAERGGLVSGAIGVEDEVAVDVRQLIFP